MALARMFCASRSLTPAVSAVACRYHEKATRPPGSNPNAKIPSTSKIRLTNEIAEYVYTNQLTDDIFQKKYEAVLALEEVAQRYRPEYSAFITGSSMNGAGDLKSDTDVTFINSADRTTLSRPEAIDFLTNLKSYVDETGEYDNISLIPGKVPLLSLHNIASDVPIDISLDGSSAIRNTYMLQLYSACDYRVAPLIMVIKEWAKAHNIKSAHYGLLSSYGLSLMVIHYLQSQEPWVVPALHKEMKEELYVDVMQMRNKRGHDLPDTPTSSNLATTGDLLCGFFHYYAAFSFEDYIIQVAEGRAQHAQETINPCFSATSLKKTFVKIEEPFSKTNVSHSISKRGHFMRMRTEFVVADDALFYAPEPCLETIGIKLPPREDH